MLLLIINSWVALKLESISSLLLSEVWHWGSILNNVDYSGNAVQTTKTWELTSKISGPGKKQKRKKEKKKNNKTKLHETIPKF